VNKDLNWRRFANIAEVKRESLAALDSVSVEDFGQRLQQSQLRWDRRIQTQGE